MALIGNLTKYYYDQDDMISEEVTITHPEDHSDPELAGKTETRTFQRPSQKSVVYDNVYLIIDWVSFYKLNVDPLNNTLFDFSYKIYNTKSDRDNDVNSFIDSGDILGTRFNISSNEDLRIKAYQLLKEQEGFENLIDD